MSNSSCKYFRGQRENWRAYGIPRMRRQPLYKLPHETRPTIRHMRPGWSESSLCAQWVAKGPMFLHAEARTLIRLDGCPEADLSLRWAHMPFYWFCHEAAHISNDASSRKGVIWRLLKKQNLKKISPAISVSLEPDYKMAKLFFKKPWKLRSCPKDG